MTATFTPGLADAVDSYFKHVEGRIAVINANRQVISIADAADWPPQQVIFNAFYLVVLGLVPVSGLRSQAVPTYVHSVQWTWLIKGTDLQSGLRGNNRGDRYRISMLMRDEIRQASFPGYTQKKTWAVDNTVDPPALDSQACDPKESIFWSQPQYTKRTAPDSGALYDLATVQITDFTNTIST